MAKWSPPFVAYADAVLLGLGAGWGSLGRLGQPRREKRDGGVHPGAWLGQQPTHLEKVARHRRSRRGEGPDAVERVGLTGEVRAEREAADVVGDVEVGRFGGGHGRREEGG
eukprot:scaffold34405_cov51-Isochrysis_galbana.AAC.1